MIMPCPVSGNLRYRFYLNGLGKDIKDNMSHKPGKVYTWLVGGSIDGVTLCDVMSNYWIVVGTYINNMYKQVIMSRKGDE